MFLKLCLDVDNYGEFGGEGGIRTHGTVTRTTVFEFYDSDAVAYRAVAKRVFWFASFAPTMSLCNR
jgi:hypothetical protein